MQRMSEICWAKKKDKKIYWKRSKWQHKNDTHHIVGFSSTVTFFLVMNEESKKTYWACYRTLTDSVSHAFRKAQLTLTQRHTNTKAIHIDYIAMEQKSCKNVHEMAHAHTYTNGSAHTFIARRQQRQQRGRRWLWCEWKQFELSVENESHANHTQTLNHPHGKWLTVKTPC